MRNHAQEDTRCYLPTELEIAVAASAIRATWMGDADRFKVTAETSLNDDARSGRAYRLAKLQLDERLAQRRAEFGKPR